uniref:Kelch-like protein 12 n=1 Tax=Phallusia mammillata TaxID=59560 RepID=A0A6F9DF94_9ASCI|nr:kelch-like protein 12 [Phallusia mammillata]
MQLDFDDMSDVINQRNKGCARSEVACFNGIVGWVNHCPLQRKELFVKLFSEVDLSSTNMSFLEMASQENLVKNNLLCANFLVQGSLMFIQRMSTSTFLLIGGTTEHEAVVYNIMSKETTQFPDLNIGRMKATSAKVGKRVFVIGGIAAGKTLLKSCEMLDLDQPDKWIVLPDMIQARHLCGSGLIAGQIYVTGGMNTYHLSSCEKFDIQANVWTRTENMLQKRCSHGCVVCNGLLYCIGGKKGTEHISSCECYDVESKKWKEIAPLNEPRRSMASVVLDGTIFAIGGIGHNKQTLSTVERYFPERNTWEYVAPLLLSCSRASACVLGTRLYVIGGSSGVASLKTVQQYDPDSDSWTICFEMKKATSSTTVVVV